MKELPVLKARKPKNRTTRRVLRHRQINEGRKVSFVAIITPTQWTLLRWSTQRICHPDSPYLFGKWLVLVVRFTWEFSEALFTRKKKLRGEWRESYSTPPKVQKRGVDGTTRAKALSFYEIPITHGLVSHFRADFFLVPRGPSNDISNIQHPLRNLRISSNFQWNMQWCRAQHSIWPKWTCKRKC